MRFTSRFKRCDKTGPREVVYSPSDVNQTSRSVSFHYTRDSRLGRAQLRRAIRRLVPFSRINCSVRERVCISREDSLGYSRARKAGQLYIILRRASQYFGNTSPSFFYAYFYRALLSSCLSALYLARSSFFLVNKTNRFYCWTRNVFAE